MILNLMIEMINVKNIYKTIQRNVPSADFTIAQTAAQIKRTPVKSQQLAHIMTDFSLISFEKYIFDTQLDTQYVIIMSVVLGFKGFKNANKT